MSAASSDQGFAPRGLLPNEARHAAAAFGAPRRQKFRYSLTVLMHTARSVAHFFLVEHPNAKPW